MDRQQCLGVLIARCSVLLAHNYRNDPGGSRKLEMIEEFRWLVADARRWGLSPEEVSSGVLAELLLGHRQCTAYALLEVLGVAFGSAP